MVSCGSSPRDLSMRNGVRDWNWLDTGAGPHAWREQLLELRGEVLELMEDLDDTQLNWRAARGRWSIGECVDHLATTNAAILVPLHEALALGRRAGRTSVGPFEYGWLGRKFLSSLVPPPPHRLKAPRRYRPQSSHHGPALAAHFAHVQDDVLGALQESSGLDLARLRARSPALPILNLPVGIWFASMAAHEARHLLQARAVRAHPSFPARRAPAERRV
jgi:hypothetical protein